jgi:KaiC/GvpD/RAD55 family RecA-like ATPase
MLANAGWAYFYITVQQNNVSLLKQIKSFGLTNKSVLGNIQIKYPTKTDFPVVNYKLYSY